MTDRIDLDALDVDEEEDPDDQPRRGDWFWRDEDIPSEESPSATPRTDPPTGTADATDAADEEAEPTGGAGTAAGTGSSGGTDSTAGADGQATTGDDRGAIPHVPRPNRDKPVGVPVDRGGAGGAPADAEPDRTADPGDGGSEAADSGAATADVETDPNVDAGDRSGMTLALTYDAVRRFENPSHVFAEAAQWADWVGVVGDVDAHVINKFVRENALDIDFFNGTGTGPAERLQEIADNPNSMFLAERMVVVGVPADEAIARAADWEFVPLGEAATKAGWTVEN